MDESTPLLSPDSASPSSSLSRHEKAAWIIDETARGVVVQSADDVPSDRATRTAYLIFCNTTWIRQLAVVILIFLSFIESPSWCSSARVCRSPDGSNAFLSGVPYISPVVTIPLNALLLAVLIVSLILDSRFPSVRMHPKPRQLYLLLGALAADAAYVAAFSGYPPFRFAPFLRALLPLFYWPEYAECTMSIFAVVGPFFDVVFFVILFTFLFGWVVTLVFHDIKEADNYFGDLATGLYSAFTALTTADWPMQVMAILDVSRPSAILFIFFIVIGVFLLLNVLLAVVYNAYTGHMEDLVLKKLLSRRRSLGVAFDLLVGNDSNDGNDDDGGDDDTPAVGVSLPDVTLMFRELRKNKHHSNLSDDAIDMVFTALDDDADKMLSRDEFMDVVDVLQLKFVVELDSPSPVEKFFPAFYASQTWKNISAYVRSLSFTYVVDAFMISNVIVVVIETTMDLRNQDTPTSVFIFSLIECAFSIVYLTEMALKIAVYGFGTYWRDFGNRFDFFVTWLLLFASAYVLWPFVENDSDIVRLFLLLRCLRLFALLADIPRFRRLVHVFSIMVPASVPLFSTLFLSLYIFAAAGVEMLGGLVYASNPALDPHLNPKVDAFVGNDFWTLNFNDMASGWFTLFSSVIVAYMTEISAMAAAVSPLGMWTLIYFVANFVVNTLIVSNCVLAFVVDLFVEEDEADSETVVENLQGRYGTRRVKVLKEKSSAHQVYANMFRERVDELLDSFEHQHDS